MERSVGQWGAVHSRDCLVLSTSISSSVLKHCANAAVVMTRRVLTRIQKQKIDINIVAYSIWWWKLPPTRAVLWFLKEFSKDEKNANDFYKLLLKILCKVSRFCFYLFFFFERWSLFLKALPHGELLNTSPSFPFRSIRWVTLVFLPSIQKHFCFFLLYIFSSRVTSCI